MKFPDNNETKCPRCGSDKLDSLHDVYGRIKNDAMNGNCEYECRECSYKFKRNSKLFTSHNNGYAVPLTDSHKCQSDCVHALKGNSSEECRTCIRNVILRDNYQSDCHFA